MSPRRDGLTLMLIIRNLLNRTHPCKSDLQEDETQRLINLLIILYYSKRDIWYLTINTLFFLFMVILLNSTSCWQEEIEIEAKVVGEQAKLIAFMVEVRRKSNGELIAIGKQWMASRGQVSNNSSNSSNTSSRLWLFFFLDRGFGVRTLHLIMESSLCHFLHRERKILYHIWCCYIVSPWRQIFQD